MSSHGAKSNVFSLSKEYSDSEKTIRSQMVVANVDGTEKSGEEIWLKEGYFGKLNSEFNCHKNDFPENCLLYINQAYLTFKDRKSLIYCDYAVLGQIVPFKSQPESDIDEFISKDNKFVKIYTPSYDLNTGEFLGIDEMVGYIMLRNVENEVFFSYGYSEEHASTLFCHQKQSIPNIFRGTAFNSHRLNTHLENKSTMSDNEDGKNQKCARETLYSFFKNVAKVSNSNLVQNVYSLLKKKGISHSSVKWAKSLPQAKVDLSQFYLTHT